MMTEGVFKGKAAQKAMELFTDIIKNHDKLDAFIKNPEQVTKSAIGEELVQGRGLEIILVVI